MDLKSTLTWTAALAAGLLVAQVSAGEAPVLETKKDKMSYVVGVDMGRNLERQAIDLDMELVVRGFRDAFAGRKLLVTDEELHAVRNAFQIEMKRKEIETRHNRTRVGAENKKRGETFLAENRAKEGVVALPSGLQYRIIKAADGRKPTDGDTVECHYRGTLIDGTEFDSSHAAGKPAALSVKGVIPGLREALKLMPAGSKWQVFIPPGLAYGAKGAGPRIGPNATLIFEMELVAVK